MQLRTMSQSAGNRDELRWNQRLALELIWAVCCLMGYMPRWFRYGVLKPTVYAVLRVVRYRRDTIIQNITGSFPEKKPEEVKRIAKASYNNLAEVIVDTVCLAGAVKRGEFNYITWTNREEHLARTKGRDWIAMASHYGSWEYFPLWSLEDPDAHFMGVYHRLKSDVFEHFYRRIRALAPNIHQVEMKETMRHYIKNRSSEHGIILGLISDQSPLLRADTEWFDFLNRKTSFVDGSEKLAMRFHIPVYFAYVERIKAGRYAIRFDMLYDGVEEVAPTEITRRYARALEEMIKARPELWMWSHKRWKHTPEKQLRKYGKMTKSGEQ